jgi:hypothetical protein
MCVADGISANLLHGFGRFRPCSTEAAIRPNKEHRDAREFPFLWLALAIHAENDRNGGYNPLNGREKVPVPADMGNSQPQGSPLD